MSPATITRKQFAHLRKAPGPARGWKSRAAEALGYSRSHITNLSNGRSTSPAGLAALAAWKKAEGVTE